MTIKSGNHSAAEHVDGSWVCRACGAESMDIEIFEEVGDSVDCIKSLAPVREHEDADFLEMVRYARDYIEEAKGDICDK